MPYARIAEGLVNPEADLGAFTWGYDNGWIDLDDWVFPYFKTGGPKNSFKVSDPDLDILLDKQRHEFDLDARKKILDMVADFMGDHIGLRKLSRRSKSALKLIVEAKVDVNLLVLRTIEGPGC